MGGYRLAFDVGSRTHHFEAWTAPLIILPCVFFILAITPQMYVDRIFNRGLKGAAGKAFSIIGFLFSASIAAFVLVGHSGLGEELKTAEKRGAYSVAEGCLEAFHAMPVDGHDNERLRVAGHYFEYSDFMMTPAFNNTESHGGPIHADSKVRISFIDDEIIRLEVIDHACPKAPDLPKPAD
jgi:hypothetical protein